jgi:hypothetical protein
MAVASILGESIVNERQLKAIESSPRLKDFLRSSELDPSFSLEVEHVKIVGDDLATTYNVQSTSIPYEGIGIGKPLTVVLEQVYLGDYPDALPWLPGDRGDIIVCSANKAFQIFDAAPRAIHLMQRQPGMPASGQRRPRKGRISSITHQR